MRWVFAAEAGLIVTVALLAFFSPASAANVPQQLRGKSITLSWTDNRVEKILDRGDTVSGTQTNNVKLYVGDRGTVFSQFERSVGRGVTEKKDVSGSAQTLHWHAEGNTLVGDRLFKSGAVRVSISFDGSFSTCSISVVHGKQGGAPIRYTNLAGTHHNELVSINVVSTSCTVSSGNVFSP